MNASGEWLKRNRSAACIFVVIFSVLLSGGYLLFQYRRTARVCQGLPGGVFSCALIEKLTLELAAEADRLSGDIDVQNSIIRELTGATGYIGAHEQECKDDVLRIAGECGLIIALDYAPVRAASVSRQTGRRRNSPEHDSSIRLSEWKSLDEFMQNLPDGGPGKPVSVYRFRAIFGYANMLKFFRLLQQQLPSVSLMRLDLKRNEAYRASDGTQALQGEFLFIMNCSGSNNDVRYAQQKETHGK